MSSRKYPSDGRSRGNVVVAMGQTLTNKVYDAVHFSRSTVGSVTGKVARLCLLAVVAVSVNTPGLEMVARALSHVEWVRKSIDHEVKVLQEAGLASKPDPAPVPSIETSTPPPLTTPATCDTTGQAENAAPTPILLDSSKLATTTTSPQLARAPHTEPASLTPPATPEATPNVAAENHVGEASKQPDAESNVLGVNGDMSGDISSANGSVDREESPTPSPPPSEDRRDSVEEALVAERRRERERQRTERRQKRSKPPPPPVQPHGSPSLARKGSALARINESREMAKRTEKLPGSRSRRLSKRVSARKETADGSDMFDFEEDYENDSVMSASSMVSAKSAFF